MNIKPVALAAAVALVAALALPVLAEDVNDGLIISAGDSSTYIPADELVPEPTTDDFAADTAQLLTDTAALMADTTGGEIVDPGTGGDIVDPGTGGDIVNPDDGSGDIGTDNRVTIGGLDFGGFEVALNLGGRQVVEVVESVPDMVSEGLQAAFKTIFGSYEPRYERVTYYSSDGTTYTSMRQVSGIAGLDFEWLATVALYILMFYCFMRVVGMVIQRC